MGTEPSFVTTGPDADPASAVFTPQVARQIRDEWRAATLRRLLGSPEAVTGG
ncbi:hypothetical protein ABZ016_24980 [Streptomyces sp. NPDC006372]|uniref:hypothetical protein n=1 Tax=Streptomyces sp. NPDC006372 TaxID=3155599 RepID=UPI0033B64419